MHVRFAYGTDSLLLDIPDGWVGNRVLRMRKAEASPDVHAAISAAFASPVADGTAEQALGRGAGLCIAVEAGLRPEPLEPVVAALLGWLDEHLKPDWGRSSLLLTHPLADWLAAMSRGPWVERAAAGRLRVLRHRGIVPRPAATDAASSASSGSPAPSGPSATASPAVEVGAIASGAFPLQLNETWVRAERRLLVSLVEPEALWGFSGGRAAILPGLADGDSRRRFLGGPRALGHPASRPGELRDNPFHRLALEGMAAAPPHWALHFTAGADGRPTAFFAGDPVQSHLAAVNEYKRALQPELASPMDIVMTAAGGTPLDSTLAGAVFSLAWASTLMRPGGTIVIFASCDKGIGPAAFEHLLRASKNPPGFQRILASGDMRIPYLWLANMLYQVLATHEVLFYTEGIAHDDLWALGLTPVPDAIEAVSLAMESHGQECKIAVAPEGCRTLARLAPPTVYNT